MKRVIISGAAGRDFHNFNICFKGSSNHRVVGFTATQIPGIEGRVYPAEFAGKNYPEGIPIYPETALPKLVESQRVDVVTLAYSDISYEELGRKASLALSHGADFLLVAPQRTMLESKVPVISVCGVRTGVGKSTVTRAIASILNKRRIRMVVVRHPMPYGNLLDQNVQRFGKLEDLDRYHCSIEEREEFEPHLLMGNTVYAGVDYEEILRRASQESQMILWDGGNNDLPFYKPSFHIVVADPWRAGDETRYYPSEINIRMADLLVINKVDSAEPARVDKVEKNLRSLNAEAAIIRSRSEVMVDEPSRIYGKKVLIVEDGPTVTHGEMPHSAGYLAAKKFGAAEIIDPRPHAVSVIKETFSKYPHLGPVLPTVGYQEAQVEAIRATIKQCRFDVIVSATPADIKRALKIEEQVVNVKYEIDERSREALAEALRLRGLL